MKTSESFDPYMLMQEAVNIVQTSPHPHNKIAATLYGLEKNGNPFHLSYTNYWPKMIENHIGRHNKIGNSSGTIHAETACLIKAPTTNRTKIFITDLPCPNCAKNMVAAGVDTIYIDHKGYEKDFALRRGHDFESMSLKIFKGAALAVYKIYRKEKKIETILDPTPSADHTDFGEHATMPEPTPKREGLRNTAFWEQTLSSLAEYYAHSPYAACLAYNPCEEVFALHCGENLMPGISKAEELFDDTKYSFAIQPVNKLLMLIKRHGLTLMPKYFLSSRLPTAREQVNLTAAKIKSIHILNPQDARDESAFQAQAQLQNAAILKYIS